MRVFFENNQQFSDVEFIGQIGLEKINPSLRHVYSLYLVPIVGKNLLDVADEQRDELIRFFLAPMALAYAMPSFQTKLSDLGVTQAKNEDKGHTAAWSWQVRDRVNSLILRASAAMNALVEHLYDTPDWKQKHRFATKFFKSAAEFNDCYEISQNAYFYSRLVPSLRRSEDIILPGKLGELFEQIQTGSNALHQRSLKLAAAYLALASSIEDAVFSITPDGRLSLQEFDSVSSGGQGDKNKAPDMRQLQLAAKRFQDKANELVAVIKKDLLPTSTSGYKRDPSDDFTFFG